MIRRNFLRFSIMLALYPVAGSSNPLKNLPSARCKDIAALVVELELSVKGLRDRSENQTLLSIAELYPRFDKNRNNLVTNLAIAIRSIGKQRDRTTYKANTAMINLFFGVIGILAAFSALIFVKSALLIGTGMIFVATLQKGINVVRTQTLDAFFFVSHTVERTSFVASAAKSSVFTSLIGIAAILYSFYDTANETGKFVLSNAKARKLQQHLTTLQSQLSQLKNIDHNNFQTHYLAQAQETVNILNAYHRENCVRPIWG